MGGQVDWMVFVSGVLAGFAVVAFIAMVLSYTWYPGVYRDIVEAKPLLDDAARFMEALQETGVLSIYRDLYSKLPSLQETSILYRNLYREMEKYYPLIVRVYRETHSPDFNKTLRDLEERAVRAEETPLLGQALAAALRTIERLLLDARHLSELALKAYNLSRQPSPDEVERFVEALARFSATMPPGQLEERLAEAEAAIARARQLVERLPEPWQLQVLSTLATAALVAGSTALLIVAQRRQKGRGYQ